MLNLRPVAHIMGLLSCCMAAMLCLPALVDLLYDNSDWQHFALAAGVAGLLGVLAATATRPDGPLLLDLRQAFLVTTLGWIVAAMLAALPFAMLGIGVTDAMFEAMSGITTTGSTVMTGLDNLPPGILLWRAVAQWIGGIGIIAMAILMLPLLRVGGMQLFRVEFSGRPEERADRTLKAVFSLFVVYVVLTAICTLAFFAFGMTAFDAVTHAMSTLSTGGYSTHDASFGYFDSYWLYWIATIFMLAGSLPFFLYVKTMRGSFFAVWQDFQARGFIIFIALVSLALALWLMHERGLGFGAALTVTAFNVVSIVSTTGFATEDYTAWGTGAMAAFLVLMFLGGCSGSTSGAIKFYRLQILYQLVRTHIKRLIHPSRVIVVKYDGKPLPPDIPVSILVFLVVFVATIAAFTVALAMMGLDIDTSFSASITAITNVGPGLGTIIGPSGNFEPLPDAAKWLLCVAMLAGRLEVLTLLIAFDPELWRY